MKFRRDIVLPHKVDVLQKTASKADLRPSHAHAHMCKCTYTHNHTYTYTMFFEFDFHFSFSFLPHTQTLYFGIQMVEFIPSHSKRVDSGNEGCYRVFVKLRGHRNKTFV